MQVCKALATHNVTNELVCRPYLRSQNRCTGFAGGAGAGGAGAGGAGLGDIGERGIGFLAEALAPEAEGVLAMGEGEEEELELWAVAELVLAVGEELALEVEGIYDP